MAAPQQGALGDVHVVAGELVDRVATNAEAGDVHLQEVLVQQVRRNGRLLPLPSDAGGEAARVWRRGGSGSVGQWCGRAGEARDAGAGCRRLAARWGARGEEESEGERSGGHIS